MRRKLGWVRRIVKVDIDEEASSYFTIPKVEEEAEAISLRVYVSCTVNIQSNHTPGNQLTHTHNLCVLTPFPVRLSGLPVFRSN